jgi:very-short-patch-repair endonuclease
MDLPNYAKGSTKAQALRRQSTDAERALWKRLRDRRLLGRKFRRQVPIGVYVVDFYCFDAKLVVEVDGSQHALRAEEDDRRTRYLESLGLRVVRFWNNDVLRTPDSVLEKIAEELGRLVSITDE